MNTINLTRYELLELLSSAAELGASRVVEKKEWLSKAAAEKRYGRKAVDRWMQAGHLEPVIQNRRVKLNADRLLALSKADEFVTKFNC